MKRAAWLVVGMVAAAIGMSGCGGTNTKTVIIENHTTTVVSTQPVTSTVTRTGSGATSPGVASVRTLGEFVRLPRNVREQVAIRLLTTHPDKCQGGKPTPLGIARNLAPELAQFQPGKDVATGKVIPTSTPIVAALEFAEAEIGC